MPTWTVNWSMEGYTKIDADTEAEALEVFEEMTPSEMRDMGDYERPEVDYIEQDQP